MGQAGHEWRQEWMGIFAPHFQFSCELMTLRKSIKHIFKNRKEAILPLIEPDMGHSLISFYYVYHGSSPHSICSLNKG